MKVAGVDRSTLAASLVGSGGLAALFTGAINSLLWGAGIGVCVVAGHAVMRTPNLKARIGNFRQRLEDIGDDLQRDYGL
jgi:hypothetical protein